MDFLNLTNEFLQDAQKAYSYNPDIPMQYHIIATMTYNNDFYTAKKFFEANKAHFYDEYAYLILDNAIEMCLNIVIDENGVIYDNEANMSKEHIYKPAPVEMEYIEYLLQNGANPYLPEHFNQFEHIEDMENDCSQQMGFQFDLSEVKKLLIKYC